MKYRIVFLLLCAGALAGCSLQRVQRAFRCPTELYYELRWVSNSQLSYVYPNLTGDVFVVDAASGEERVLIPSSGAPRSNFHWSPDGDSLIYEEISLVHLVTSDGTPITSITDMEVIPQWSPDSSQIIYNENRVNIVIINRDGSGKRVIYSGRDNEKYPFHASWSSDGQRIAAVLTQPMSSPSQDLSLIAIMNVDGTSVREYELETFNLRPILLWSPDNRWIALMDNLKLRVMEVESGEVLDLVDNILYVSHWEADSSGIFYWEDNELKRVGLDGTISTVSTLFYSNLNQQTLSPDGTRIVYMAATRGDDPTPDLYIANFDGSDTQVLVHNPAPDVCFNP